MLPFISHISLIRYLIIWRVNSSLVRLPRCLPTELSRVLGMTIASRLPTRAAREWHRALSAWGDTTANTPRSRSSKEAIPQAAWPIEAVLFAYNGKRAYGQGETILWELKLMGPSADHGLFLEIILPAMEEAATTADASWGHANGLWGHFDIQAVYTARGPHWEPVVDGGQLDLDCRPSSTQWMEGLTFGTDERRRFHHVSWITPFDLAKMPNAPHGTHPSCSHNSIPPPEVPTFQSILDALISRLTMFLPGKHPAPEDVWALVSPEEHTALSLALQEAQSTAGQRSVLKPAPKHWPGRWIGAQTFEVIPQRILPYLELASILHLGKQTHFGCGTFRLD